MKRTLVATVVLAILVLSAVRAWTQQPQAVPVVVGLVVEQEVVQPVTLVGTVEPRTRSLIASESDGIVASRPVEEGDMVATGDPVAELDTTQLRLTLASAEGLLERYRQELAELRAGTRPKEIERARAAMLEAEAEQLRAAREKRRVENLHAEQFASVQDLNTVEAEAEAAVQRVEQTRAAYELAVEGPRKEEIARAEAMVAAQEAEVARLRDKLSKARVLSPFKGVVVRRYVEVGQWVSEGGPVVELIDLERVRVVVPVPERYVRAISVGDRANVEIDALGGERREGEVIYIVPQADVAARTFPVVIEMDNVGHEIKSGMFARITLLAGKPRNAMLVPKDAVVTQGPLKSVFVVADGAVHQVPVELGMPFEGSIEVQGALEPGQQVVVRGNERLRDGQPVTVAGQL